MICLTFSIVFGVALLLKGYSFGADTLLDFTLVAECCRR